jgi:hypothetical protein
LKEDEPNVFLHLASSYDERGVRGYETIVTDGKDQQKINCMYENTVNAMTGLRTTRIVKRPGFLSDGSAGGMSASSIPFIASYAPLNSSDVSSEAWMFSVGGNHSSTGNVVFAHSNTLATSAGVTVVGGVLAWPAWVDKTSISGTETLVLQVASATIAGATRAYYATTFGTFTEITDSDFTSLVHRGKMEFMDGFAFQMESRNRIYNSDVNTLTSWGASSFITKGIEQDTPVGLARLGRTILAFGIETVEGFHNAGNTSGSPLGRIQGLARKIGLGYTNINWAGGGVDPIAGKRSYYAKIGGRLYFVGVENNPRAKPGVAVYAFDGSSFNRVSTPAIEKILFDRESGDLSNVGTFNIEGKQALAIALSRPNVSPQRWLMFFPEWNEWFEWNSTVFQPAGNGDHFVGIGNSATAATMVKLGQAGSYVDGSATAYTMTYQFKLPQKGSGRKAMHFAGVIGDTQTSASNLSISFSDNDYQSFSTARTIDLTKDRKQIYRCGNYRQRAVKLEHSAATDCRLEAFIARVE